MRRPGEVKTVLGGLILRSAQPELRDLPCLAEAKYFLALALTVEASPADKPGPHDDCVASHLATDWPVERVLDWAPLTHAPSKGNKDTEPTPVSDVVSVQRLGPTPEEILISATARHTAIGDLLDQIAAQAQLRRSGQRQRGKRSPDAPRCSSSIIYRSPTWSGPWPIRSGW